MREHRWRVGVVRARIRRFLKHHWWEGVVVFVVIVLLLRRCVLQRRDKLKRASKLEEFEIIKSVLFENATSSDLMNGFENPVFDSCEVCQFRPSNYRPNSDPSDVILTVMFEHVFNLVPFVRTLRTTGCRAQFIVLTDQQTLDRVSPAARLICEACSTRFVLYGTNELSNRTHIFSARHIICYNFILQRLPHIKRVFLADLFDTVFQGDPFTEDVTSDSLLFTVENNMIDHLYNRAEWAIEINRSDPSRYKQLPIVNGGVIIGGARNILRYLRYFLEICVREGVERMDHDDQWYLNFLVYTGRLEAHNIEFSVSTTKGRYASIAKTQKSITKWVLGEYKPRGSRNLPLVIHQFDDIQELQSSVMRKCPIGDRRIYEYMRHMN